MLKTNAYFNINPPLTSSIKRRAKNAGRPKKIKNTTLDIEHNKILSQFLA
jgi:hypothetical protein